MNYTEKYHLPQWVKTDRIMMDDFNQMCADIESGLLKTAADAASALAAAADTAASASQQAQATADKAVQDAAKAQAKADAAYSPSQPPYVVGTYEPTGAEAEMTIDLGFQPSFVAVSGSTNSSRYSIVGMNATGEHLVITTSGFRVKRVYSDTTPLTENAPFLLDHTKKYTYIAFR